ncbi:MAG: DDE-type integrase/transposase/recombinase [Thaumarchaeota archaeon]|nr:DDE-type integrase/transposase/recombinase [Nitrososphaerota archaeon]
MSTRIESHDAIRFCKYCRSGRNKSGNVQIYKCHTCGRVFSANFGFRYRRYDPAVISEAMHLFYSGTSSRAIADVFEARGIDVGGSAIRKWIKRYAKVAHLFTESLTPDVGKWYRADEVWVKAGGNQCYLFASMDDDTRYWIAADLADNKFHHNADGLLRDAKKHTGKAPTAFITDKLHAYDKASRKIFGNGTYHKADAGIRSKRLGPLGGSSGNYHPSNNRMERFNGTVRGREKTFRGLSSIDTAIFKGMKVHCNHVRKHDAVDNKTPAEAAGIHTEGRNKWKTLIQNSSLHLIATDQRV